MKLAFDTDGYMEVNKARDVWLRKVLADLPDAGDHRTALDVACGAGYFSGILKEGGYDVTGVDLRASNIEACRERYPDCTFDQFDLDQDNPKNLGKFDLVLMFGILYHLPSPARTISDFAQTINDIGIISTRVAAGDSMACVLFEELQGDEHNVSAFSSVPTLPALLAMFQSAGLTHIYKPDYQPDHAQWKTAVNGQRQSFIVVRRALPETSWKRLKPPAFPKKWNNFTLKQERD